MHALAQSCKLSAGAPIPVFPLPSTKSLGYRVAGNRYPHAVIFLQHFGAAKIADMGTARRCSNSRLRPKRPRSQSDAIAPRQFRNCLTWVADHRNILAPRRLPLQLPQRTPLEGLWLILAVLILAVFASSKGILGLRSISFLARLKANPCPLDS
jgi:hypothetical protein